MASDLPVQSATALQALVRSKQVSSRELLTAYLDRVDRLNGDLNAVVTLDADRAMQVAAHCDEQAAHDRWLGPLHGLPCTIKDALDTAGLTTTGGAVELADRVPTEDAAAVARVRAAGAVIFGKTNLPRWSGDYQTAGGVYGTTNNPWDLARTPGGSSGGAAAAVATGLTAFEVGTDIGGSIRVPSNFCGIAGHKPTFGVVPQRGYVAHLGGGTTVADINVVGPLARTVADLDLLLAVLAGPEEPEHGWSLRLPDPAPAPWRVSVLTDDADFPVSQEVRAAVHAAAAALAGDGARVDDGAPPVSLGEAAAQFMPLITAAMALSGTPGGVDATSGEDDTAGGTAIAWLRHDTARVALQRRWRDWYADHDVLLAPAWPTPAVPHDDRSVLERTVDVDGAAVPTIVAGCWLGYAGVVGLPVTVVRVGTSRDGLPIGVQVIAGSHRDRTALAVAARLEQLLGGYTVPPYAA
ncbi:MAG TPA: amidase family protein [Mycobacteriales bacterium]